MPVVPALERASYFRHYAYQCMGEWYRGSEWRHLGQSRHSLRPVATAAYDGSGRCHLNRSAARNAEKWWLRDGQLTARVETFR
jgi:hypothetical protein